MHVSDLIWETNVDTLIGEMVANRNQNSDLATADEQTLRNHIDDWTPLLSASEQGCLRDHEEHFFTQHGQRAKDHPGVVLVLSQHPDKSPAAPDKGMPCFTRATSQRMWVPALGRWLTAREKAASFLFPTSQQLADAAGVSLRDVPTHAMCGNSFHVGVQGMLLVAMLVCTKLAKPASALKAVPAHPKVEKSDSTVNPKRADIGPLPDTVSVIMAKKEFNVKPIANCETHQTFKWKAWGGWAEAKAAASEWAAKCDSTLVELRGMSNKESKRFTTYIYIYIYTHTDIIYIQSYMYNMYI